MDSHLNAEKIRKITIERVEKFLSKSEWTDVNLWSKLYSASSPDSISLRVWSVPDTDPNHTDRVSYEDMLKQPESAFREAKTGETFAPEWSTHWFKGMKHSLTCDHVCHMICPYFTCSFSTQGTQRC